MVLQISSGDRRGPHPEELSDDVDRSAATRRLSIIGFSAIRSLATMLATGVQDHKTPTPPGFWEHAAAAAAACAIVGPRFGAGQGDAFSVGLIHDLGHAILHGVDPQTHTELVARAGSDGAAMCAAEVAAFGMDHAQACARVLSDWNFPAPAVEAIAMHHVAATPDSPALQATLVAANAVAHIVNEPGVDHGSRVAQLAVLGMEGSGLKLSLELTAEYTGEILATLPNRRS